MIRKSDGGSLAINSTTTTTGKATTTLTVLFLDYRSSCLRIWISVRLFQSFSFLSIMNLYFEFSQLNWSPHHNYGDLHSHRYNVQRTTTTLFFNPERIAYILRFDELDLHLQSSQHTQQFTWFHEDRIDIIYWLILLMLKNIMVNGGEVMTITASINWLDHGYFQIDYGFNPLTHQLNFIPQNYFAFGVIATYSMTISNIGLGSRFCLRMNVSF